jgi:hypothetical protein
LQDRRGADGGFDLIKARVVDGDGALQSHGGSFAFLRAKKRGTVWRPVNGRKSLQRPHARALG